MPHDGPLLEQSLKAAAGALIRWPRAKQCHPDRDRLAVRFEQFPACCLDWPSGGRSGTRPTSRSTPDPQSPPWSRPACGSGLLNEALGDYVPSPAGVGGVTIPQSDADAVDTRAMRAGGRGAQTIGL